MLPHSLLHNSFRRNTIKSGFAQDHLFAVLWRLQLEMSLGTFSSVNHFTKAVPHQSYHHYHYQHPHHELKQVVEYTN